MSNTEIKPAIGRHAAVCRSIQFQTPKDSQSRGGTAVVIGFELTDPDDLDCGTFITYFGYTSDSSIEHTVKALGACGWTGDDMSELPALVEQGLLAETVSLVVDHEEKVKDAVKTGEWHAKVKWVNPPGGGGKIKIDRPLDGDGLADFGARMKSRIRAARGASGSRPTSNGSRPAARNGGMPPTRDAPPPDDSDIPF